MSFLGRATPRQSGPLTRVVDGVHLNTSIVRLNPLLPLGTKDEKVLVTRRNSYREGEKGRITGVGILLPERLSDGPGDRLDTVAPYTTPYITCKDGRPSGRGKGVVRRPVVNDSRNEDLVLTRQKVRFNLPTPPDNSSETPLPPC